ncbi:MAG: hypothetical protein LBG07_04590, partial [Treponema sp.]|nr:hypothetical protein [Treponema sp.]
GEMAWGLVEQDAIPSVRTSPHKTKRGNGREVKIVIGSYTTAGFQDQCARRRPPFGQDLSII